MTKKVRKVAWEHIGISPMAALRIQDWLDTVAQDAVIRDEQCVIIDDMLCIEVGVELDFGQFISHRLTLTPDEWFLNETCN